MEIRIAATGQATEALRKLRGGLGPMPERRWKQLRRYSLSTHVDGLSPSGSDVDPIIDIAQLVKNLILIDAGDDVVYRLVGAELLERHGPDLTGRITGPSGLNPKAAAEWQAAVEHVSKELQPRPLVLRIGNSDVARNVMILLALADRKGRIEMLLFGSFYNEHFKRGAHIHDMDAREGQVG
jgi:hypothetical protein